MIIPSLKCEKWVESKSEGEEDKGSKRGSIKRDIYAPCWQSLLGNVNFLSFSIIPKVLIYFLLSFYLFGFILWAELHQIYLLFSLPQYVILGAPKNVDGLVPDFHTSLEAGNYKWDEKKIGCSPLRLLCLRHSNQVNPQY